MKSKYYFPHTATVFFLLTVAVALFSWIGSIYGLGKVQSLLSPEGIRWELRHAMGNFVQTPALGIVMMLFLGFGITVMLTGFLRFVVLLVIVLISFFF